MRALSELGGVYQGLKQDQKALEAYRRAESFASLKGTYVYPDTVIAAAGILARRGKHDEAIAELQLLELPKMAAGVWKAHALQAWGDILRAQGKKVEAIAMYKEALAMQGLAPGTIDRLNKAITDLSGP